jgi:hypothetical protein
VADAATADLLLLPHGDEVPQVPRALVDVRHNPSIDLSRRLASLAWEPSRPRTHCRRAGRHL